MEKHGDVVQTREMKINLDIYVYNAYYTVRFGIIVVYLIAANLPVLLIIGEYRYFHPLGLHHSP
jgi:hypothetical protein